MANKLALVFGGSRGIGAACVQALAKDFDVAFTSVSGSAGLRVDVRNAEDVKGAFDAVEKQYGRKVDCVVGNAGIGVPPGPIAQYDVENFRKLVEVNLVGAFNVLREAGQRYSVEVGKLVAQRYEDSLQALQAPRSGGALVTVRRWSDAERVQWARNLPRLATDWVGLQRSPAAARNIARAYMNGLRRRGAKPLRDWDREL